MKTVVLAGGLGSRLQEFTTLIPKPMVEIGSRPLLWHIMKCYARYGFREFCVALGYKGHVIKDYFVNYHLHRHDVTVNTKTRDLVIHNGDIEDWCVHLVDTGLDTQTGGRVRRLASLIGRERFMLTYGDGVADLNIDRLLTFHESHDKLATVTAVRPPSRFGALDLEEDQVTTFAEKPRSAEAWVNGGFFVFEPRVLDYIDGDDTALENEPLERLAADDQLMAYRHDGFWQCMDTLRDQSTLNKLWLDGSPPWRNWD